MAKPKKKKYQVGSISPEMLMPQQAGNMQAMQVPVEGAKMGSTFNTQGLATGLGAAGALMGGISAAVPNKTASGTVATAESNKMANRADNLDKASAGLGAAALAANAVPVVGQFASAALGIASGVTKLFGKRASNKAADAYQMPEKFTDNYAGNYEQGGFNYYPTFSHKGGGMSMISHLPGQLSIYQTMGKSHKKGGIQTKDIEYEGNEAYIQSPEFGDGGYFIRKELAKDFMKKAKRTKDPVTLQALTKKAVRDNEELLIKEGSSNRLSMMQQGGVNTTGYLDGAPTANNAYNIIPSGNITMQGVSQPIKATGSDGQSKVLLPNSGNYQFKPPVFEEKFQQGGMHMMIPMKGASMPKKGINLANIKVPPTNRVLKLKKKK